MDKDSFTTAGNLFGNQKPFTSDDLMQLHQKLMKFEPPKALLLLPQCGQFLVIEIEADKAREIMKEAWFPIKRGLSEIEGKI